VSFRDAIHNTDGTSNHCEKQRESSVGTGLREGMEMKSNGSQVWERDCEKEWKCPNAVPIEETSRECGKETEL